MRLLNGLLNGLLNLDPQEVLTRKLIVSSLSLQGKTYVIWSSTVCTMSVQTMFRFSICVRPCLLRRQNRLHFLDYCSHLAIETPHHFWSPCRVMLFRSCAGLINGQCAGRCLGCKSQIKVRRTLVVVLYRSGTSHSPISIPTQLCC